MIPSYPPPHRTNSLLLPILRLSLCEPSLYWQGPDFFRGNSNPFLCISCWKSPTKWSIFLGSEACLLVSAVRLLSQFWVLSCSVISSGFPPWSSYCCRAARKALSMPYVIRGVILPGLMARRGTEDCLHATPSCRSDDLRRIGFLDCFAVHSVEFLIAVILQTQASSQGHWKDRGSSVTENISYMYWSPGATDTLINLTHIWMHRRLVWSSQGQSLQTTPRPTPNKLVSSNCQACPGMTDCIGMLRTALLCFHHKLGSVTTYVHG